MSESNVDLIHRWFEEVWNQGREGAIDAMMAEDCKIHDLEEDVLLGPQKFKQFHRKINAAIAEIEIEVEHLIECGENLAGIFCVRGTHRATGKPVEFHNSFFGTIRQGKVVEVWHVTDFLTMFVQTGALPATTMEMGLTGKAIA